jgi:hypothetical protein
MSRSPQNEMCERETGAEFDRSHGRPRGLPEFAGGAACDGEPIVGIGTFLVEADDREGRLARSTRDLQCELSVHST